LSIWADMQGALGQRSGQIVEKSAENLENS